MLGLSSLLFYCFYDTSKPPFIFNQCRTNDKTCARRAKLIYSPFHSIPFQLSGVSKLLAGGQERGLSEGDLQAIMKMMGPSDLSDLEDEVKVIQQNVRAWILRCNYKSLRKAAKTLQVMAVVVVMMVLVMGGFACAAFLELAAFLCCCILVR